MTTTQKIDDIEHISQLTVATLCAQLVARRKELGLNQDQLAQKASLNRMTVGRVESSESNPKIENFVRLALALNLTPNLSNAASGVVHPQDIVHRGLAHSRTVANVDGKDREREAALAAAWQDTNHWQHFGVQSLLPALIPGHTQEQATAAATVIQWLGSQVGFDFLQEALSVAGYDIVARK